MTNPSQPKPEATWSEAFAYPLATAGAIAGALLGAVIHSAARHAGFYAILAVGLGAGFIGPLFARRRGVMIGVIAAVVALAVGLWAEWWTAPMNADDSLGFFITHLNLLTPFQLILHGLNPVIAFFCAWRK